MGKFLDEALSAIARAHKGADFDASRFVDGRALPKTPEISEQEKANMAAVAVTAYCDGITQRQVKEKTFEAFDASEGNLAAVRDTVKAWQPDDGFGLLLYGTPGTGKTHLVIARLAQIARKDCKCRFVEVASLMDLIRAQIDGGDMEAIFRMFEAPRVLALDDLGAERTTEFVQEKFLRIINKRAQLGRINLVTSNLTADELEERYDGRILDRLKEHLVFVGVKAPSRRDKIMEANRAKLARRLKGET